MEKYDFSVIICCYNSDYEKLKKTLISIAKQKNVSYEIIISDDGSKDRAIEQIKAWVDEHNISNVRYNFLPENIGTVRNILSAVKVAQGKYVKTISPGDYLFDEYSLQQYLNKFNSDDYKLVFSRAIYYTQDRKMLKFYNPVASGTESWFMRKNVCQFADCFLGATFAAQREYVLPLLQEITGVVLLLEDYPLTYLTLSSGQKIGYVNKDLVWYECETGVSRTDGGNKIKNDFLSFFDYIGNKYPSVRNIKKSMNFLKVLKTEKKMKVVFKSLIIKPSFILYCLDRVLTSTRRKIMCSFRKVDISMMDKITTL